MPASRWWNHVQLAFPHFVEVVEAARAPSAQQILWCFDEDRAHGASVRGVQRYLRTTNSVRRFFWRPSSVSFGARGFGGPGAAGAFGAGGGGMNAMLQMQQMQAQQQQAMQMQMMMAQQQQQLAAQHAQLQSSRQLTTTSARSAIGPDELSAQSDGPKLSRREAAMARAAERKAANAARAAERQSRLAALRTK